MPNFILEWDLQLPNDLVDWIENEFPDKVVIYRGKKFVFHGDIPIDRMIDIRNSQGGTEIDHIKVLLKVLSKDPIITDAALNVMGQEMLRVLHDGVLGKNESPISPSPSGNTSNISS